MADDSEQGLYSASLAEEDTPTRSRRASRNARARQAAAANTTAGRGGGLQRSSSKPLSCPMCRSTIEDVLHLPIAAVY